MRSTAQFSSLSAHLGGGMIGQMKRYNSQELCELLGISDNTLKHWRAGRYQLPASNTTGPKFAYYRADEAGVPKEGEDAGAFKFYTYDLVSVRDWLAGWKQRTIKQAILLRKLETLIESQ